MDTELFIEPHRVYYRVGSSYSKNLYAVANYMVTILNCIVGLSLTPTLIVYIAEKENSMT